MDAQALADLIAGSCDAQFLDQIIANLAEMAAGCPGGTTPDCTEAITLLKQGYENWTGEALDA